MQLCEVEECHADLSFKKLPSQKFVRCKGHLSFQDQPIDWLGGC